MVRTRAMVDAPARAKLVISQLEFLRSLNSEAMMGCVAKRMEPSALPTKMPIFLVSTSRLVAFRGGRGRTDEQHQDDANNLASPNPLLDFPAAPTLFIFCPDLGNRAIDAVPERSFRRHFVDGDICMAPVRSVGFDKERRLLGRLGAWRL